MVEKRKAPIDIIPSIINSLKRGEQTITELSKSSGINRVTLNEYLDAFEKSGLIVKHKNGRETKVSLKDNPETFFGLPVKEEDNKKVKTIYSIIKKTCVENFGKEPTKTQVYKILNEVNQADEELNLPVGWYRFGPCGVVAYLGTEEEQYNFDDKKISLIREKTTTYAKLDNQQLEDEIYKKENNKLYQLKKEIEATNNYEEFVSLLIDIIKYVPKESENILTDFLRGVMIVKEIKKDIFSSIWKYIATIEFRESLKNYYGSAIETYLAQKIEEMRKDCELQVRDFIVSYTEAKYSEDPLYQKWVKKRR